MPFVSKVKKMYKVDGPDAEKSEWIKLEFLMDPDNPASKYSRQFVKTTKDIDAQGPVTINSLVLELEQERTHCQIATHGVLALFNAIAKHQTNTLNSASESGVVTKDSKEVQKLTKHGYLDQRKAVTKEATSSSITEEQSVALEKPKWNALQDDYMLSSKLKDWDKESSEEDDEEAADNNCLNDDWEENGDSGKVKENSKQSTLMKNKSNRVKPTVVEGKSNTNGKRKRTR
jgi:hypothetical protein